MNIPTVHLHWVESESPTPGTMCFRNQNNKWVTLQYAPGWIGANPPEQYWKDIPSKEYM